MTQFIPLTQGQQAIVDDEDYPALAQHRWYYLSTGYATRAMPGRAGRIYMHRVIANAPDGMQVDHIDGNRLNNTRSNLRLCTIGENVRYRKKIKKPTSSQYKGVYFYKPYGKWRAIIKVNYKRRQLGHFDSEIDAAKAYDAAAKELFGPFAWTNF